MNVNTPFRLDGRIALVTGAGRSLGKATATVLGRAGAKMLCAYERDANAARTVADGIISEGGDADTVRIDVSDVGGTRQAVEKLADSGRSVDILVNNAAIRPKTRIADVSVEEWDMVHSINLRGPFFLSQAVIPHMIKQGWGRIINIGGIDAYRGSQHRPHNVASKLGLVGLARALANETAIHGLTVNTVVPGMMDTVRYHPEWSTDMAAVHAEGVRTIPMGRLGRAKDIGYACLFLASEEANYITGQELMVTGGAHPLVRQRSREDTPVTPPASMPADPLDAP